MCKYKLYFKGYLSLLVMLFLSSAPVGAMEIEDSDLLDVRTGSDELADTDGNGLLEIHSSADLGLINLDLTAGYELIDDLVLYDVDDWQPIGTNDNPFTGVLLGNSHHVTFLTSLDNTTDTSGGLFGHLREAKISNIYIEFDGLAAEDLSGILAGSSYNSNITNVHLTISGPTKITTVSELLFGHTEGGSIWESSAGVESSGSSESDKPNK